MVREPFYFSPDDHLEGDEGDVLPVQRRLWGLIPRRYPILRSDGLLERIRQSSLWECEPQGESKPSWDPAKHYASRIRLVAQLRWDDAVFRSFARHCAERAVHSVVVSEEEKDVGRRFVAALAAVSNNGVAPDLTTVRKEHVPATTACIEKASAAVASASARLQDAEARYQEAVGRAQVHGNAARTALDEDSWGHHEGRGQAARAHAARHGRDIEDAAKAVARARAHLEAIRSFPDLVVAATADMAPAAARGCAEIARRVALDPTAERRWQISRLLDLAHGRAIPDASIG